MEDKIVLRAYQNIILYSFITFFFVLIIFFGIWMLFNDVKIERVISIMSLPLLITIGSFFLGTRKASITKVVLTKKNIFLVDKMYLHKKIIIEDIDSLIIQHEKLKSELEAEPFKRNVPVLIIKGKSGYNMKIYTNCFRLEQIEQIIRFINENGKVKLDKKIQDVLKVGIYNTQYFNDTIN